MRFIGSLIKPVLFVLCSVALATSCKDSDVTDHPDEDYGYVQVKLYKKVTPVSRAGELDYLSDAYKVKLNFIYNNTNISDIAFFEYYDTENSEYGVRTDRVKLLKGDYTLASFTVYDELENELYVEYPGESVVVEAGKLTLAEFDIDVVNRGRIKFDIVKDFSRFPQSRAREREYAFSEIRLAIVTLVDVEAPNRDIVLRDMKTSVVAEMDGTDYMATDTVYRLPAGKYQLKRYALHSATDPTARNLLETRSDFAEPVYYIIEDNRLTEAEISVELVETDAYIRDYYALKELWEKMGGPEWSYLGTTYDDGANWNFDKDIDRWGDQPGVHLHSNGRVGALIIGGFGPVGDVPDCIGLLTEVSELSLGANYDLYDGLRDFSRSVASRQVLTTQVDRSTLIEHPIERKYRYGIEDTFRDCVLEDTRLWREASRGESELERVSRLYRGEGAEPVYQRNSYPSYGEHTNGITGISEEIGNLTKLTHLYISNTMIEELPDAIGDLHNITDLELYNNPRMKKFPVQISNLPSLVLLNIAHNKQWSPDEIYNGLDALFNGAGQGEIQGIYCNNTRIQRIPPSISQLDKVYLLDFEWCELEGEITPFTDNVRIGKLYLDHNRITGFPDNFADFRDCEEFSASYNLLTEFPNIFNKTVYERCEKVDFSHNLMSAVQGGDDGTFRGIIADRLNLSYNNFTKVPEAFTVEGTQVQYYSYAYNQIEEFPAEAVDGIWYGTLSFDMRYNKLSELPNTFNATNLPYLYSVDLSWNRFDVFPTRPMNSRSLEILICQAQRDEAGKRILRNWPSSLYQHTGLGYVDISRNDILTVVNWPHRLTRFIVNDNPNIIIEVPSNRCTSINSILVYDKTQNITGCDALQTDAQQGS